MSITHKFLIKTYVILWYLDEDLKKTKNLYNKGYIQNRKKCNIKKLGKSRHRVKKLTEQFDHKLYNYCLSNLHLQKFNGNNNSKQQNSKQSLKHKRLHY